MFRCERHRLRKENSFLHIPIIVPPPPTPQLEELRLKYRCRASPRALEDRQTSTLSCAKIAEKFHANVWVIGHVTKSSVSLTLTRLLSSRNTSDASVWAQMLDKPGDLVPFDLWSRDLIGRSPPTSWMETRWLRPHRINLRVCFGGHGRWEGGSPMGDRRRFAGHATC